MNLKRLLEEENIIWVIGLSMLIGKKDFKNFKDVDLFMKEQFK